MNLISKRIAAVLLTSVFVFPVVVASKAQGAVLGVQESLRCLVAKTSPVAPEKYWNPKPKTILWWAKLCGTADKPYQYLATSLPPAALLK